MASEPASAAFKQTIDGFNNKQSLLKSGLDNYGLEV